MTIHSKATKANPEKWADWKATAAIRLLVTSP